MNCSDTNQGETGLTFFDIGPPSTRFYKNPFGCTKLTNTISPLCVNLMWFLQIKYILSQVWERWSERSKLSLLSTSFTFPWCILLWQMRLWYRVMMAEARGQQPAALRPHVAFPTFPEAHHTIFEFPSNQRAKISVDWCK